MSAVRTVAELMEVAATTAPKGKGKNYVVTKIIDGKQLQELATAMKQYAKEKGIDIFVRDGGNVERSACVLLIGMKDAEPVGVDCGACGYPVCLEINRGDQESEFLGAQCAIRVLDMGIAIGSAVKTAQALNVDNRVMYTIGAVSRKTGLIDADFVVGIPLSVSGKSIFFDR